MDELELCGICHKPHPASDLTEFDGMLICRECLSTETVICTRCGERIWADDDAGSDRIHLCQSCYDNHYTTCEDCGRIIHQNDAYYDDDDSYEARCYHCYCRHQGDGAINDYYYKPEPIFYGESSRYFGIELEVDDGGEIDRKAAKILDVANSSEERVYIKHDGSLNDGFEIVTHPMTLDYHLKEMPWAEILAKAREMGYTSHQAGTCGLHVHINRTAFGDTEEAQDKVIARILYFFEKHWEELLKFSRRTYKQLKQWANRYGLKEHPQEILNHAKGDRERYTCINLTNSHTIEVRIFRGSLKLNTLLATMQLLDRICDVALCFSDEEIKEMSWTTFVAGCAHMPELVQYLKERRLYVNEPIAAEAEV